MKSDRKGSRSPKSGFMARILLAEDDTAVRDFVRRALEMDGHDVVPVSDGGEALERALSPIDSFDLLLSDIRMPVVDGLALALQVGRERPDLPILLMTGYAEHRDKAYGLDALIKGVIQKPFTLEYIRNQVRDALEEIPPAA
jgi:two-component system cell cycle response regulator CpdR